MSYDADSIKRSVSLSGTVSHYGVKLFKNGKEYVGLCPFHSEKTPSFQIFVGSAGHQLYHCKGCGATGDVIKFVEEIKGVSFQDACESLGGTKDAPENRPPIEYKRINIYEGIDPDPVLDHPFVIGQWGDLYNPKRAEEGKAEGKIKPSLIHEYRNATGELYGLVLRADLPGGKKETPMVRHVRLPDGRKVWARFSFAKPRPLYGLDGLEPDVRQVLVVEGEKARDHLHRVTGRCVVTWPGGTNGVRHVDWSPLKGKDVILWPDHDEPGYQAMVHGEATERRSVPGVAQILKDLGCSVRWIDLDKRSWPEPLESGFDAADLDWSKAEIDQLMKDCVSEWSLPDLDPDPSSSDKDLGPVQEQPAEVFHQPDEDWMQRLSLNQDGALIKASNNNHLSFLEHHPDLKGVIGFNSFAHRTMVLKRPPWDWLADSPFAPRPIEDADYPRLAQYMEQAFRLTPKPKALEILVETVAKANAYDPLGGYLLGLKWDGVPRAARLLCDYFGCAETPYAAIISRRFVISAVARALKPGCKMDTMLILEGPQGAMKSSGIRALFGEDFFSDHISDVESKDAMMEQQGIWCLEVGEMHSFNKKEANAVKKFMVQQVDRFRPPYGRNLVTAPRRSLMVGTINPDGAPYLKDPTGARRFWPVMTNRVERDRIEADRDQIWAEAVSMYQLGNPWWIQQEEEELVQKEQQARTAGDIWEGVIAASVKQYFASEIYPLKEAINALGLPMDRATNLHFDRIAKILKKLDWHLVAGSMTDFERHTNGMKY